MDLPDHILAHVKSVGCTDRRMLWDAIATFPCDLPHRGDYLALIQAMVNDGRLEDINGALRVPQPDPVPRKPSRRITATGVETPMPDRTNPTFGGRPMYPNHDGSWRMNP